MTDTTEIKITVRCSKCPISIEDCDKIKELFRQNKCPVLTIIEQALRTKGERIMGAKEERVRNG